MAFMTFTKDLELLIEFNSVTVF